MARGKAVIVVQFAATVLLVGASLGVLCSLFSAPLLALPALLLAWGSYALYRLRRWGGVVVCGVFWCALAFLLFLFPLWGLVDDPRYPTPLDDPSFALFFWALVGLTVLVTTLVGIAWRQLDSGD